MCHQMLLVLNATHLYINTERAVSTCKHWQIENLNVFLHSWRWCQMNGQERESRLKQL